MRPSRSQRWSPMRRALVQEPRTILPTEADCCAQIYAVTYHGEHTRPQILVLAANEEQAKVHAGLRWKFHGNALEPHACLKAEVRSWSSAEMKAGILTFESLDEFTERQRHFAEQPQ